MEKKKKSPDLSGEVKKLREKGMSVRAIARKLHIGDHKATELVRAVEPKKPKKSKEPAKPKCCAKPKTVNWCQSIADLRQKRGFLSDLPTNEKGIKREVEAAEKRTCQFANEIFELKKKGLTLKQIGRRIGRSDKFVSAIVRQNGWQNVGKKPPRNPTTKTLRMSFLGSPAAYALIEDVFKALCAFINLAQNHK